MAAYWEWLPRAYGIGADARDDRFTRFNMEIAYRAGLEAAHAQIATMQADHAEAFAGKVVITQAAFEEMRTALSRQNDEICQTLGKALGYPWFKDDQKNFPGATEAIGVCVGEHVAESLADETARKIAALRAERERLYSAVVQSEVQFRSYATQHRAKIPPDEVKARTNASMADLCARSYAPTAQDDKPRWTDADVERAQALQEANAYLNVQRMDAFWGATPEVVKNRLIQRLAAALSTLAPPAPEPAGKRNADLLFIRDDEDPAEYRALVERKRAETDADLARERNADLARRVREVASTLGTTDSFAPTEAADALEGLAREMEGKTP